MFAKFETNSGGITWWSKFELIQVLKWIQIQYSWKDNSSYKLYTLGPLCLWQCFFENLLVDVHDVGHAEADIDFGSILARYWGWHQELLVPIMVPGL